MTDLLVTAAGWIWIPITVVAALTQTARNAVQRGLVKELGTLGATLVRFLYGLPFAALMLAVGLALAPLWPQPGLTYLAWCLVGSVGQILATIFLLQIMSERNFALGIAYSKTELIQIAALSVFVLGDPLTFGGLAAILIASAGILMLAPPVDGGFLRGLLGGLVSRTALLGIACGASFSLAAVGFRGAVLALAPAPVLISALFNLAVALTIQTVLLGGYLLARDRAIGGKLARLWRESLPAGLLGASASLCWMVAFALATAAQVRTVGLVELLFGYVVSRRLLDEALPRRELVGAAMIAAAVFVMLWIG